MCGTCSGIVRQDFPQEHLSLPMGKPVFSLLENFVFLSQAVAFLWEALFMLVHLHCKPFAFSRPVKIHYFFFASTLVPQIAGSIYCDSRDGGSPWIVSLFAFSGPGRKVKLVIFPLPPPFAPTKIVQYLLHLSRGGEKLDGVSSTSL